jgi:hypothetical protein
MGSLLLVWFLGRVEGFWAYALAAPLAVAFGAAIVTVLAFIDRHEWLDQTLNYGPKAGLGLAALAVFLEWRDGLRYFWAFLAAGVILTAVRASAGKPRPTDFTSNEGSGHSLGVSKREKP